MTASVLLDRLQGVRASGAGRWMARCPAHEDKRASLSIRELSDGRVLLHDFGGCGTGDVLVAIGMALADLFPERLADSPPARDRGHFHALRAALESLRADARVVVIAASDCAAAGVLPEADADAVAQAAGRIAKAVEVLYGR